MACFHIKYIASINLQDKDRGKQENLAKDERDELYKQHKKYNPFGNKSIRNSFYDELLECLILQLHVSGHA